MVMICVRKCEGVEMMNHGGREDMMAVVVV
jgi:hypothetical protein